MDSILFYGIFMLASVWVALEPGPGFVKLSTQAARRGTTSAFFSAFGMFAGALPYILLVATGLSWVIEVIPNLLTVLKIAGGLYLLWLAFDLLRKSKSSQEEYVARGPDAADQSISTTSMMSFLGGFTLVILNPRTLVFYSAFLPLFLRSSIELPASTQLLLLGLGTSSIFLIIDMIFVLAISKYGEKIMQGRLVATVTRYIGATALSFFGLRLLLDRD